MPASLVCWSPRPSCWLREPPRLGKQASTDAKPVPVRATIAFLREKRAFLIPHFCAAAACALIVLSTVAWMPAFLARTYDFTPGEAGFRYGLAVLIGGVSGVIICGAIANRLNATGKRGASIVVALWCAVLAFVPTVLATLVENSTVTLVLSATTVFGYSSAVGVGTGGAAIDRAE